LVAKRTSDNGSDAGVRDVLPATVIDRNSCVGVRRPACV
jgi:hypothetical protein